MQEIKSSEYQELFLSWLDQYHRKYLEGSDVLQKLQYLKDKLTQYIYETTVGKGYLKNLNANFWGTKFDGVHIHFTCAK
jgi:hypothetical protein